MAALLNTTFRSKIKGQGQRKVKHLSDVEGEKKLDEGAGETSKDGEKVKVDEKEEEKMDTAEGKRRWK